MRSNFKGRYQYEITSPALFTNEWNIKSLEDNNEYWIQFNIISPTILTHGNKNPMGKIYSPKFMSFKKNIDISTSGSLIRVEWSHAFRTFKLRGETNIKGFEKINWVWKREMLNSKMSLEDYLNGQCIAEFGRHRFSRKNVGDLYIYPELPNEINWLIMFSACYSHKYVQRQERSAHGGS